MSRDYWPVYVVFPCNPEGDYCMGEVKIFADMARARKYRDELMDYWEYVTIKEYGVIH